MYAQKSFNMVTTFNDREYKTKVSQLDYTDPQREGENPVRDFKEKEYTDLSLDKIQSAVERDFNVQFYDVDEFFNWFWDYSI